MESVAMSSGLPSGREVLVVEDEVRIRNMLSQALKQMGFQATLVASAEAATRTMAQRAYDILILDLNLPGMGGMELLESLRRQHRDLQVIILTGFGDLDAAKKAIHFDVVEFLTKPCELGEIEIALDRARKRRRGQIVGEPGEENPRRLEFETKPKTEVSFAAKTPDVEAADRVQATSLEELEQGHILAMLKKHNGNRIATAAELGISLRKLYYRLGEYQKKGLVP